MRHEKDLSYKHLELFLRNSKNKIPHIIEISLFGSVAKKNQTIFSDYDILILHSISSEAEYADLLDLISKTKKDLSKKNIFLDVFLCHVNSLDFVIKYLQVFLYEDLQKRVVLFTRYRHDEIKIKKVLINKSIVTSNALYLLNQVVLKTPTIKHEERRKNTKTFLWFFKHMGLLSKKHQFLYGLAQQRLKNIKKESPTHTFETDLKFIKKSFLVSDVLSYSKLDLLVQSNVELARLYFTQMKNVYPEKEKFSEFVRRFLKVILKIIELQDININKSMQNKIQYFVNFYLNSDLNTKDRGDSKKCSTDYIRLSKFLDVFIPLIK